MGDVQLASGEVGLDVTGGVRAAVIKFWENVCRKEELCWGTPTCRTWHRLMSEGVGGEPEGPGGQKPKEETVSRMKEGLGW